jgi:ribonuclease-3
MDSLVTIFRTRSDVEASIVRGLLEANGVSSILMSPVTHSVFPLTVNELGEVRIVVRPEEADEALRIIESHRTELTTGQVVPLRDEFETLERSIEYRFRDRGLLEHALTHTSRANEDVTGGVVDNESLEFLGDAILGFVVADLLYRDFPSFDEGQKSKAKARLVSTSMLARLAQDVALGAHLLLGRGEEKTGGRQKQALLADAYEALIAAIYLDGGIEQARAFVLRQVAPLVAELHEKGNVVQDHKSALQEYLQSRNQPLAEYRLAGAIGPDHQRLFRVDLIWNDETLAQGEGPSKKDAEQEAALRALEVLKRRGPS